MADHPNLEVMRRALKAFQTGDVPTLTQVFAQDVVWRVPGKNFLARDYRGQAEVFGLFGKLMELTNGTFALQPLDVFANDRGGVFVDQVTAQRNGKTLDVRLLLHVTISGGQITEGIDAFHQEHVWDAFWA
jgi:ketosteroid isomerase-like protein